MYVYLVIKVCTVPHEPLEYLDLTKQDWPKSMIRYPKPAREGGRSISAQLLMRTKRIAVKIKERAR